MRGKKVWSAVLFLALAGLTFYVIFKNQDMGELWTAIKQMNKGYLALAVGIALFFVSEEGVLIWYLFCVIGDKTSLLCCLRYAFIGFFYSGITPSASGGQPMQLYHMTRDGHKIAHGTVVLLCVATAYKLVLVLMGLGISVFWWSGLKAHLGEYLPIYFLGLFLNAALVMVLFSIMLNAAGMERFLLKVERCLVKLHLMKSSERRIKKIHSIVNQYRDTVNFLKSHGKALAVLLGVTVVQRCSVFVLTYFIYRGMGLEGANALTVMALQAVVYIAVDMLPLPGSQGITELMYVAVYRQIFVGGSLTISMCVTRGINFYFLLIVSAAVAAYSWWRKGKKQKKD